MYRYRESSPKYWCRHRPPKIHIRRALIRTCIKPLYRYHALGEKIIEKTTASKWNVLSVYET